MINAQVSDLHVYCNIPFDELNRIFIKFPEVVRGKRHLVRFVAQPPHHLQDALEEFLFFLLRIGVVVAQVRDPPMRLQDTVHRPRAEIIQLQCLHAQVRISV